MSLNQEIIDQLMLSYPQPLMYDHLLKTIQSNRQSIDRALKDLVDRGYPIQSSNNRLDTSFPLVSPLAIDRQLHTRFVGHKKAIFPSLTSTNDYAKNNLGSLQNGSVIFAHEQTAGKGRLGRVWSSPVGKSISMSIVLKPTIPFEDISLLTQLSAAALVDALNEWVDASIKWPNDVLINNKKIAGILVETEFSGSDLHGIIIGIGINTHLDLEDIPSDLHDKATSIKIALEETIDPNIFLSRFFTCFETYYSDFLTTRLTYPFLTVCRNHSALLGKEFWIINSVNRRKALIQDIDNKGGLSVTYCDNNETATLTSTDFSIRGDAGYI